jgi:hypothetical protein
VSDDAEPLEEVDSAGSQSLELIAPADDPISLDDNPWKLIAHSKKVLRGWRELCEGLPGNARRCFAWLQAHPQKPIPLKMLRPET